MHKRLPFWFRQEIPRDAGFIKNRLKEFENSGLNTVCLSARCPNLNRCFEDNSVTFMIMGSNCSRNCGFCAVDKGRLNPLDALETYNLALTIRRLNLSYVVIPGTRMICLLAGLPIWPGVFDKKNQPEED